MALDVLLQPPPGHRIWLVLRVGESLIGALGATGVGALARFVGFLILAIAVEFVPMACRGRAREAMKAGSADQWQRAGLVERAQCVLHPSRDELVSLVGIAAGAAEFLAQVDRWEYLD